MRALVVFLSSWALLSGCGPAVSTPPASAPQAIDPARRARLQQLAPHIDEYLHVRRATLRATGAALGIVLDGELAYAGAVGLRDAERNELVDADTVFRMTSLTKSFTALAALKLRDEGKLDLDAPLGRWLPRLRLVGLPADAPPPSVRQLLTMTSGLPYDDEWGAVTLGYDGAALDALIEAGVTLSSAPGERFAYSNLGYALLGRVIAAASGDDYREYVSAHILAPLGMRATVWDAAAVPPERLAIGYRRDRDALLRAERPSDGALAAAGGLYTSLRDYARYMAFQLAAYPPRDGPDSGPVRRSTLREMHAGQRAFRWDDELPMARRSARGQLALSAPSYGFGWVNQTTCAYEGIVQQGGFAPGYFAYARLLPRDALGIVVFSTTTALGDYETFEHVLGMLREAGVLDRASPPPAPALVRAADALTQLASRWDDALAKRSLDANGARSPLASLRADLEALARVHGACHRQGPLSSREPSSARFRLECERGAVELEVFLTPAHPPLVQAVHVREQLPPSERLGTVATGLERALGSWDEAALLLFDAALDARRLRNAFEGFALEHGRCSLGSALASDGESQARYRLTCARQAFDLELRIDASSGKVTRVTSRPAARGDVGTCSDERVLAE